MSLSQKLRTVKIEVEKSAGCYKAHTHTRAHAHTHTHTRVPQAEKHRVLFFWFYCTGC